MEIIVDCDTADSCPVEMLYKVESIGSGSCCKGGNSWPDIDYVWIMIIDICMFDLLIYIHFVSQFDAEFRRWSFKRHETEQSFDKFATLIEQLHKLANIQFLILYIDPRDNDLLPINNDDNFGRALKTARPLLRVIVQRKGEHNSYSSLFTVC